MKHTFISTLLACSVVAACAPELPPAPKYKESRWLEQKWSAGERYWFHHQTQGTSTLPVPYKWFISLEQPEISVFSAVGLFADEAYLQRFGFIPSPKSVSGKGAAGYGYANTGKVADEVAYYGAKESEINPDGLPVGFARMKGVEDPTTGKMLPDQLGLTCAACHTGHIEYKGVSLRIDGGSAASELGKLRVALATALYYTKVVPGRFGRFAERVLGPNATDAQTATLQAELDGLLAGIKALTDAQSTVPGKDMEEGFSRLDALTRIGNTVFSDNFFGADASIGFNPMDNYQHISAPVKYPHTWDTSWFNWVQYDSSIMQPMIRNAGEAMGVSAKINMTNPSRPLYHSTIQVKGIYDMEQSMAGQNPLSPGADGKPRGFTGLSSPKWPAEVLGQINVAAAGRGEALYKELCQGCHLPPVSSPDFWSPALWTTPNQYGESYLKVTDVAVSKVGTDPAQANILPTRKVKVPSFLGVTNPKAVPGTALPGLPGSEALCDWSDKTVVTETLFAAALGYSVQKAADTWYTENKISPEQRAKMDGYRPNCLRAAPIYKARPLNGIWATPPYLHNGSVPTLRALLSTKEERPKTFCLGNREYDPKNVGYEMSCETGTFTVDTSLPGNLNTGHEFRDGPIGNGTIGRALNNNERNDLIEYLKTL